MKTFLDKVVRNFSSPTFRTALGLVIVVEAVTIITAWLLLDSNISRWLHDRTVQTIHIAQASAASGDWSLVDTISTASEVRRNGNVVRTEVETPVFDRYRRALSDLTDKYFGEIEGDVYLVVVDKGIEYRIDPFDQHPMDRFDKANEWETAAYQSGKTTYMKVPYSDISGTYIAAFTPIYRSGKIVGLMAAEYDSATLAEFRGVVRKTFWLSILPALLLSLVLAYVLASVFVEPMELFRRIDETAKDRAKGTGLDDPLAKLSPREREVAELIRRGLKNREIADKLVVTPETVKQHLKNIKEKTGLTRVELAVEVYASGFQPGSGAPATA
jgi:RNA polymerase sigma factor (sigma-70 family)